MKKINVLTKQINTDAKKGCCVMLFGSGDLWRCGNQSGGANFEMNLQAMGRM